MKIENKTGIRLKRIVETCDMELVQMMIEKGYLFLGCAPHVDGFKYSFGEPFDDPAPFTTAAEVKKVLDTPFDDSSQPVSDGAGMPLHEWVDSLREDPVSDVTMAELEKLMNKPPEEHFVPTDENCQVESGIAAREVKFENTPSTATFGVDHRETTGEVCRRVAEQMLKHPKPVPAMILNLDNPPDRSVYVDNPDESYAEWLKRIAAEPHHKGTSQPGETTGDVTEAEVQKQVDAALKNPKTPVQKWMDGVETLDELHFQMSDHIRPATLDDVRHGALILFPAKNTWSRVLERKNDDGYVFGGTNGECRDLNGAFVEKEKTDGK